MLEKGLNISMGLILRLRLQSSIAKIPRRRAIMFLTLAKFFHMLLALAQDLRPPRLSLLPPSFITATSSERAGKSTTEVPSEIGSTELTSWTGTSEVFLLALRALRALRHFLPLRPLGHFLPLRPLRPFLPLPFPM